MTVSTNWLRILSTAGFLTMAVSPSRADYLLQPGDTLEIGVTSVSELKQKVPIGVDGEINYPLLGPLKVAGMTLSDVQRVLADVLPKKIYQMRTIDGRELNVSILAQEITIRVAEYRPVYLSGDVAKPGEQTFRPGLTVRQAISLAGGYDIMRFRMSDPFLEASDLRSEYNSAWLDYAKSQVRLARLASELDGRTELPKTTIEAPLPAKVLEEIVSNETEQLRNRLADVKREKEFTEKTIADARSDVATLDDRVRREADGVEADRKELEEARALLQRGTVPSTRVTEARRSSLLSSTQWLQTVIQASQSRKQVLDLARQLERTEATRHQDILREKQDEEVKSAALRARINAIAEKLLYTGAVKTQLVRGTGSKPTIAIMRRQLDKVERINADEDAELQPGDVVDVSLGIAPIDAIAN